MAEATTNGTATEAPSMTEDEIEALLIKKDDAPQASAETTPTADANKTQSTEASEGAVGSEGAADATTATDASKQQPGTSDKALQKMQQDFAASDRKLDALLAKINAGGSLSPKEQQEAQQAQRKIDSIRAAIQAKNFEVLDHGTALAESVIETDQTVAGLVKTVGELSKKLDAGQTTATWSTLEKQYPGVNVTKCWEKSVADAAAVIGADNPQLQSLANTYFHQRCDTAAKSVAGKSKDKPAAKIPPPVTPNGANVSVSTGTASGSPTDPDAEYERRAMALVKKET